MSKSNHKYSLPKLWEDASLRPYLGEVARRHGIVETLALPSMRDLAPLRIEKLFVQPLLSETQVSSASESKDWPKGQSLLKALGKWRRIVVLGDPGSGKTTLSNWLAWRLASGLTIPLPPWMDNLLPVPVVLRELPSQALSIKTTLEQLADYAAERLLGSKAQVSLKDSVRARIQVGSYLLILDGIDEVSVSQRDAIASWMSHASGQDAFVLATSRIVGYEDRPIDGGPKDTDLINYATHVQSLDVSGIWSKTLNQAADPYMHLFKKRSLDTFGSWSNIFTQEADSQIHFSPKGLYENTPTFISNNINQNYLDANNLPYFTWEKPLKDGIPIRELWRQHSAKVLYLMPFDSDRIAAFVANWYRERTGSENEANERSVDLLAALAKSETTQQLARTPNLLSLMAIVHRERAHLPDGKALLYKEIANAYINTIDKQRKILPGDALAAYGWEAREAWLAYVGFQMQQKRSTESSNKDEDGVLVEEAVVLDWLKQAMHVSGVEKSDQTSRIFLHWVARRSGLLLPRGEGRYAFVHLSFQEYFCARHLASRIVRPAFIRDKLDADEQVTKPKLCQWTKASVWRETLVYLFELLSAERDADWVDDLAEIVFGAAENTKYFNLNQSIVATRILTDRHIRLGPILEDLLATRCCAKFLEGWQKPWIETEPSVFQALFSSGYATIVEISSAQTRDVKNPFQQYNVRQISTLKDIQSEIKLRLLIVLKDNIVDIKPLTKLKKLEFLLLDSTHVCDITPLSELSNLKSINLNGTQVSDISPLAGLSKLEFLTLDGTQVSDITPLSELSSLKSIYLNGTQVSDISPLAGLSKLEFLTLDGTQVSDITPLSKLSSLKSINLNGTQVSDITPLSKLSSLKSINLNGTQVRDITPLSELSSLKSIYLNGTQVSDIAPLSELSNLDIIDLGGSQVRDITPLSKLSNLTHLYLDNIPVSDIMSLALLAKLEILVLGGMQINDITPLAELANLWGLLLLETQVSNIKPLARLYKLELLTIRGSQVSDITPLVGLRTLKFLSLIEISVSDLTPLSELRNLETLHINGIPVSDITPLSKLNKLEELEINDTQICDVSPLAGFKNLIIKLNGKKIQPPKKRKVGR